MERKANISLSQNEKEYAFVYYLKIKENDQL